MSAGKGLAIAALRDKTARRRRRLALQSPEQQAVRGAASEMKIVSAASAFPRHYYEQEALLSTLQQYWGDRLENPQLLSRLFLHAGVDDRYLALPMIEYYGLDTRGAANRAWFKAAEDLGASHQTGWTGVVAKLLQQSGERVRV